MGHLHNYINDDFGKGKLVYPGSSEIWKTSEIEDYRKNGKGFIIVDLDTPKPSVKRVKIDLPREFIERSLDYNDLTSGIEGIKETIQVFDKKPILDLNVENVSSSTYAYEAINDSLGDLSLNIRPKFNTPDEENIDLIIDKENALGLMDLLSEKLEHYNDEDVTKLAVSLYDLLSKDMIDDAKALTDEFYKEKYDDGDEVKEVLK